ncbi:MAG TPA: PadR family transcriptional regulator [Conexibacter sp.]|nr:PadR family transcriptional regulator [Conexibacter sp.]
MSLKHAVLALIAERRGYGYELVQRFEERIGPGWRLNPSAIYPALDQLERDGLAASAVRHSGSRRSPRVVYAPTPAGAAALEAWQRTTDAPPEPLRADLHLRVAFARPQHRAALAAQLAAHERACAELLARYPRDLSALVRVGGGAATPELLDAAVVARLRAELAWVAHARAAVSDADKRF